MDNTGQNNELSEIRHLLKNIKTINHELISIIEMLNKKLDKYEESK